MVLSHVGADLREIEDLADLIVDHLGIAQLRPAVRARRRRMDKHLVGVGHLREVLALRAGLLCLAACLCPALLAVSGGGLSEPFGRGRHRGVARVAPEALLEIRQPSLELGDA